MARISKATRAEQLISQMKDQNYDPMEELIKIAKCSRTNAALRVQIAKEIMQYAYPKQKAIEVDHRQETPITFNFDLSGDQGFSDEAKLAEAA